MRSAISSRAQYVLFIAALLASPHAVRGDEETPDWWRAEKDATAALSKPESSLAALVQQVTETKPVRAQQLLFRLSLLTRAAMTKEAIQTLHELKKQAPDLGDGIIANMYHDLFDHRQAFAVAEALVDIFAENISSVTLENRLVKHFLESGWSVDRIDAWFAAKPPGVDSFWVKERFRFNRQHGRGEDLEQVLKNRVRANPASAADAIAYLEALSYAPREQAADLDWMAMIVKPPLATEIREVAVRIKNLRDPQSAATVYQRALPLALTDAEVRQYTRSSAVQVSESTIRARFASQIREELADCLLQVGQATEAQKWMVAADEIRAKHGFGRDALFAGRVQSQSGQRVVEGKIKTQETVSANEPSYWRERAEYYRGRNEPGQEEEALKKGLSLTIPEIPPEVRHRGRISWRSQMLADYIRFLQRQERNAEALKLLRTELADAPAISDSASVAARMLAFDFERYIDPDDAVLWSWLENRPKWEHVEERLLWRMLEHAKSTKVERHLVRAEELAFRGDASRAKVLGWIENRMQLAQRSLPLLEHAVAQLTDENLQRSAGFTLFESYLDIGNWQRAESVWPIARHQLTAHETPEWYSKIAVVAARSGAKADAMRIWERTANFDLTCTRSLGDLANAGLREELKDFYRKIQHALPASEIPAQVLANLSRP